MKKLPLILHTTYVPLFNLLSIEKRHFLILSFLAAASELAQQPLQNLRQLIIN